MRKYITLVIPLLNEAESLEELYRQIVVVFSKQLKSYRYEIIFINDGSTDQSLAVLKKIKRKAKSVIRIISFRRNYGKAAALNSGFSHTKGDLIITMDADLQDGPENIPLLVSKINEGFDLVVGWKRKRHDPVGKTIPSKAFNFFVGTFSGVSLHDFNSGLKAIKKDVCTELFLYGELHRFIPVLVHQKGYKVTEVPVVHHPRLYGKSKYGWSRLIKGFLDFLTVLFLGKFAQRPMHFFGILGFLCVVAGIAIGLYLTELWFQGESIGRRPLLILAVLLQIAGLQLLSIGLIAEMLVSKLNKSESLPITTEF